MTGTDEYHGLWQEEFHRRVELERILEEERKVHIKIAMHADRLHMQLQAIKEAAFDELCSLTPVGPENLEGLQEVE
jgi:hypothetical protein